MVYFNDLHSYLHQSSLLIQAYPNSRITTKYSLPRKANPKSKAKAPKPSANASSNADSSADKESTAQSAGTQSHPARTPSATLTLKTFHPDSGICLKYRTDKAAEVGRLMAGLGRLAKGEAIDMPSAAASTAHANEAAEADGRMDLDPPPPPPPPPAPPAAPPAAGTEAKGPTSSGAAGGAAGGGGGKSKKKKGKK